MNLKKNHSPSFLYLLLGVLFSFFLGPKTICAQENSSSTKEYGWFALKTNLDQFYLIIDGDFEHSILARQDEKIKLESGARNLLIVWENINDKELTVEISPDSTTSELIVFSSFHRNPNTSFRILQAGRNLEISTDKKSDIYIDGKQVGTSTAELFLPEGDYELFIKHPESGSLKKKVHVSTRKITSIKRFNEKPNSPSFALRLIPGMSYVSNNQKGKAITTYSLLLGSLSAAFYTTLEYDKKNEEYNNQYALYLNSDNSNDAIRYRKNALSTLNKMESLNTQLTVFTVSAITIYLASTIDGLRKPRDGYRTTKAINTQLGFNKSIWNSNLYPEITLTKRF